MVSSNSQIAAGYGSDKCVGTVLPCDFVDEDVEPRTVFTTWIYEHSQSSVGGSSRGRSPRSSGRSRAGSSRSSVAAVRESEIEEAQVAKSWGLLAAADWVNGFRRMATRMVGHCF